MVFGDSSIFCQFGGWHESGKKYSTWAVDRPLRRKVGGRMAGLRPAAPLVAMQSIATAQVEIFLKKEKSTLYGGGKATKAIALHPLTGWTT